MKKTAYTITAALVISLLMPACKSTRVGERNAVVLDTLDVSTPVTKVYRAMRTRDIDILHTRLELSFNWDSAFVNGIATLDMKPYFYALDTIRLDARNFEILSIDEVVSDSLRELKYTYDKEDIHILPGRRLTRNDSIRIRIGYVAKPNTIEEHGSRAITSDKGLYFIKPDEKVPEKPRQLWTQGETESNSCWFPTVDSPNEKFTQEIFLTVESSMTTISNGMKMFSVDNSDGTKTEYWKMDQPHSAYLVMIAVGPFACYRDEWRDREVNYYLDSAYLPFAKAIFGNTPEMLTFYSDYLSTPYPWPKFDQVVVHDYVSGAMENTSAVIHGEFMQRNSRQLLDANYEEVIAHELFHHWFGDLVTCESWSNLTLNEGFATYGEYLWNEYKYGRDQADYGLSGDLRNYMAEAGNDKKQIIRFYYDDREDMFDSHSYAKGGRVLHMLRKEVGEEAFRKSLKLYLDKFAYSNAEIHDLRECFEKVCGRDLNWFFNQWFLSAGHPVLNVAHRNLGENSELEIVVDQMQDTEKYPLFRFDADVEIHCRGTVLIRRLTFSKKSDTVRIKVPSEVIYMDFDKGEVLLAEKKVEQSIAEWMEQAKNSELFIDKKEAFDNLRAASAPEVVDLYLETLRDSFWASRSMALHYLDRALKEHAPDSIRTVLEDVASNDAKTGNRAMALFSLGQHYRDSSLKDLFTSGLDDSSLQVVAASFRALAGLDRKAGLAIAGKLEKEEDQQIILSIAELYAEDGDSIHLPFYLSHYETIRGFGKFQFMGKFADYLLAADHSVVKLGLPLLRTAAIEGEAWWIRLSGIQAVMELHSKFREEKKLAEKKFHSMKEKDSGYETARIEQIQSQAAFTELDILWKEIGDKEENSRLKSIIDDYNSGKNVAGGIGH